MFISNILDITNSKVEDISARDGNIVSMNTLVDATDKDLSFFHNSKYQKLLQDTKAKAVLIDEENAEFLPKDCIAIINSNPYLAMAKLSKYFYEEKQKQYNKDYIIDKTSNIDPKAHIGKYVNIGKNTTIMAGAFIGDNVFIGDDCIIYPNAVIYNFCIIKNNTFIHANTTIGSDGFGYAIDENKEPIKIYHIGNVEIGDHVEIGANTAIDRAVLGSTKIDDYCKFDNLIQVGHNCTFGKKTGVASGCGFSGSVSVGSGVMIYGQAGFNGHISICDGAIISARAGVTKDIKEPGRYSGFPAIGHREWIKQQIAISRLNKK